MFLSFMNDCNMSIHGVVWCKFYITNITFELLVLFMKCCNGYNQILLFSPKLALHISHLNGLFSSWKVLMCPFMSCLDVKSVLQMSHLKAFFPSWTVATCFFKLCFDLKFILQISHLHCCFPTYIVLKYVFSNYFCILKSLLQISHMYFFILSWTDASWNSKAVFPPKLAIYPSMMWKWSTGHI